MSRARAQRRIGSTSVGIQPPDHASGQATSDVRAARHGASIAFMPRQSGSYPPAWPIIMDALENAHSRLGDAVHMARRGLCVARSCA
jgi:hypothetical protein